jgi:hypothetical protein
VKVHGADVVIADEGGTDPHRVRVGFQADEPHPCACHRVGGDVLTARTAVPGTVAEHHVDLGRLIEAQRDLVGYLELSNRSWL